MNNNFLNLILKNTPPEVRTFDEAAFNKKNKENRAARDKANPPEPKPARVELNRLRSELWGIRSKVNTIPV